MSCLLHIRRGRWELAWRAIGEESLQPYTFLTFMAEYLMRAAIETPPLPKEAVDVLSWLLAHGYDLGLLVEGLATELKRLSTPSRPRRRRGVSSAGRPFASWPRAWWLSPQKPGWRGSSSSASLEKT